MNDNEILGVEVFGVGFHNGDTYTMADIRDMAEASKSIDFKATISVGHWSSGENKGFATNLTVKGKKLLADFVNIPDDIFEKIKEQRFDRVSSEIIWDLVRNKKVFRRVLSGVALLGVEIPAVADLKPLSKHVFEEGSYEASNTYPVPFTYEDKGLIIMPEDLKKFEELQSKFDEMNKKYDAQAAELTSEKSKVLAVEGSYQAYAAKQAATDKLVADLQSAALTQKVDGCKIPALRPLFFALYSLANETTAKVYNVETKLHDEKSAACLLDEVMAYVNEKSSGLFQQHSAEGAPEAELADPGAEVHKRVLAYQAANPGVAYQVAASTVLAADSELSKQYLS